MELRERNKDSLQEKLKEKWATRDFTPPKDHTDKFLMSFFFIHSTCLLIECLVFLVPNVYEDNRLFMSLVTIAMFCETIINWHRSYFDIANYVRKETKDKYMSESEDKPQDWKDCFKCQVYYLLKILLNPLSQINPVFMQYKPFENTGKRRNCSSPAISTFPTLFSNSLDNILPFSSNLINPFPHNDTF